MVRLPVMLLSALAALHIPGTRAGFPNVVPTAGDPWPRPSRLEWSPTFFRVDVNHVHINITGESCPDLEEATARYEKIIDEFIIIWRAVLKSYKQPAGNGGRLSDGPPVLDTIEMELRSGCNSSQYPEFGMDESYELKVNTPDAPERAVIIADTIWGAYRGLETMSQLFYLDSEVFAVFVRNAYIQDYPRYKHRGLLLDTGRHFLSVDIIKQNLDLMAFHKYNVFHWHVVDDPSFPFYSTKIPFISLFGAYRADKFYNPDDVADIIEYARKRGIRVIPEFDTPGHVRSWGAGIPGLLTECYTNGTRNGKYGSINPTDDVVYALLAELFDEITKRFPDKYLHLGGDEVNFGYECWMSNPEVRKWMQKLNLTTPQEIEDVYIRRLLELVEGLPSRPEYIVWQDVVDHNVTLQPNTIVEVWKEPWLEELDTVTLSGHRAILSTCWYLNRISYGIDWPKYYSCEPESFNGTDAQNQLVIGGEACMWGEYVDNSNVISRTWPRAAAPAERLWSPKNVTSVSEAKARLEEQRCRLVYRGFGVEPSNGPGFC
ncbi:beta-hexosaminidase subunit beta-like [Pollicipes pollicipes]|uniref:beta-hexosaminidase subunit beta-like n=1 Tax=Pollicipes pollicipes TaxID=41117 RepID=UPI001884BBC2|nr:beta-hexosaminidase subunit beta-like [Pollicipes pollicipes]